MASQSEDGAARGAFDLVDWLAGHLIAESVDLGDIFEVFRLRAWPVIEELESLLIEVLCIKAPKDVLEIKSTTPLIDQHHAGQMIICIEVFEWILHKYKIFDEKLQDISLSK